MSTNYEVRQKFTVKDLSIGDLMYDILKDTVVKVVFVGNKIEKYLTIQELKKNNVSNKELEKILLSPKRKTIIRQVVLEDVNSKEISLLNIIGKDGNLPKLKSDNFKPRFRYLIKIQEEEYTQPIPLLPLQPYYDPYHPYYPNYPYPDYPYIYCSDSTDPNIKYESTTSNIENNKSQVSYLYVTNDNDNDLELGIDSINLGNINVSFERMK